MAEVSIVTAARAAAEQQKAAAAEDVVLNPGAREFLPWWRLGSSGKKALSADAPEFVMAAAGASVDGDGNNATPQGKVVRKARVRMHEPPQTKKCRQLKRMLRNKKYFSRWQNSVKRTIFVKQIDHTVTEQILASVFGTCGTVVDCRICGDPSNGLSFGFVELQCKEEAYAAILLLDGAIIGLTPLKVSPSRTAICPINPMFLPQVCRIKFMDSDKRTTNLAFVEFAEVDGAIAALDSTGIFVGGLRMRICPSKTPIRTDHYCNGSSSPVLAGSLVETNQAADASPLELVPVNGVSTIYDD
ncbi:hypothetical protein HU200_029004 [Digitaria exilis]|uniref:RRM domain-containing protein n=1 Tax=Digitaria exilis TaxID=1010633 RepID=A0A835BRD1_9POAL|nr:hypothetical protein HU200_029004 [Digitaria exilis]